MGEGRYITEKSYVFEPETGGSSLVVHRKTGALELAGNKGPQTLSLGLLLHIKSVLENSVPPVTEQESSMVVYGILGFIQLLAGIEYTRSSRSWTVFLRNWLGYYMMIITNRDVVGSIRGHGIYNVTSFQILPLAHNLNGLSDIQVTCNWLVLAIIIILKLEKKT